jgi:hypothetical protein
VEFKKIHSDIQVVCINDDVVENLTDTFVRRIKGESLNETDFTSYWDLGKRPVACDKDSVCGYKGVSVFKHNNNEQEVEAAILKTLGRNRSFKPILSTIYCKLKFRSGAGKVWQNGKCQPYHCNFFKEDSFAIAMIDVVEIMRCNNV